MSMLETVLWVERGKVRSIRPHPSFPPSSIDTHHYDASRQCLRPWNTIRSVAMAAAVCLTLIGKPGCLRMEEGGTWSARGHQRVMAGTSFPPLPNFTRTHAPSHSQTRPLQLCRFQKQGLDVPILHEPVGSGFGGIRREGSDRGRAGG